MNHEGCFHPEFCLERVIVYACPKCGMDMTRSTTRRLCVCCDLGTERDPCPHR